MQIHDALANLAASLGVTFDEVYFCSVLFAFGCVGGVTWLFSVFCNVFLVLSRALCRLLRTVLNPIRRILKVHFQK